MAMSKGTVLNQVFDMLKQALSVIDAFDEQTTSRRMISGWSRPVQRTRHRYARVPRCGCHIRRTRWRRRQRLRSEGHLRSDELRDTRNQSKNSPVGPDGIIELSRCASVLPRRRSSARCILQSKSYSKRRMRLAN